MVEDRVGVGRTGDKKRILLVATTSKTWQKMRNHGFVTTHGLAAVLRSLGHDVEVLPTCFLESARLGFAPGEFDQVWLSDLIGIYFGSSRYHEIDPAFWSALLSIAPIRVGYETETLLYGGEVGMNADEHHESHVNRFLRRVPFLTHVLANDETVVDLVRRVDPSKHALWVPASVSERWIPKAPSMWEASEDAVFAGTVYGKRAPFYRAVRRMLTKVDTADNGFGNEYDAFIETANRTLASMECNASRARKTSAEYGERLDSLLEREFAALLTELRRGGVVVNLPAYTRGLVHRVPEAIAAGRVVLTNRLEDRPKTMEWLEANPGVFLYDTPAQLKRALSSLIGNPAFVHQSACDAVVFTRETGSAEVRLADALTWIDRTSRSVESQIRLTSSEWLLRAGADG